MSASGGIPCRTVPSPLFVGARDRATVRRTCTRGRGLHRNGHQGLQIDPGDSATCKLLPFTLQIDLWAARIANRIDDYTHDTTNHRVERAGRHLRNRHLPRQVAPGNFGTIDIGNANNATPDLSRQIRYGPNAYDLSYFPNNTVQLGANGILTLNGETGISAAIKDDLAAIIGQPRILPLHATMRGNGNNAYFDIVAFVGVTVLDVKLTGSMNSKYVKIQPCYVVDGTAIGGGTDGTTSRFIRTPPRLRRGAVSVGQWSADQ